MPKKKGTEIADILRYEKQILLMKRIIDEIMEPTEEEKKYKEKHKKDMDFPKSFQDDKGSAGVWEWHERNFGLLAKNLSVLADYYNDKSSMEDCKKAWEAFERGISPKGFFEDIQKRVHEKYITESGEFDALTNPRVRRMVRIADAVTDLEGLKNAIYERERAKDIQEYAYKVRVNKKKYLDSKKDFADKYKGMTIEQRRKLAAEYLSDMTKLNEKNQKLENQIREDEQSIRNTESWQVSLTQELKQLTEKKLEYDTNHRKKALEVSVIKAYRTFNKVSKNIEEWKDQIRIIEEEEKQLDQIREGTRKERKELFEELLNKNDPVALKYKDTYAEYHLAETLMADTELAEKHPKLLEIAMREFTMMNAASGRHVNRMAAIEDLQVKIGNAEIHMEDSKKIIDNNKNLSALEHATDDQLINSQHELRKMEEDNKLVIKSLEEQIEQTTTNMQNAKDFIDEKTNAIASAESQIKYNNTEIEKFQKAHGKMKEIVDKAATAMYHYNKLQSSKREFVDSMDGFNFGTKTANRVINKANTYNLHEGTRFLHKNTPEFMKMDKALEAVKQCDPANREVLMNKLKELGVAAKEYRDKKLKDGGFNTGMRNTRLTKAKNLITMCELGIQELSAIPEKKEKALVDFKEEMKTSLEKKEKEDSLKKLNDMERVDAKLNRAHEKADKFDAKLELADKKIDELQELIEYDDDFSK